MLPAGHGDTVAELDVAAPPAEFGGNAPGLVLICLDEEMVAVVVRREERCQVVVCRYGQDLSSGSKFVLKPGDSIRFGRGRGNEVVLDYEGVSKHHAEISLREKMPEELIHGSRAKSSTMLSLRDLSSKNGMGIRMEPFHQDSVPSISSFERIQSGTSQVVEDGCCIVIPAKSRNATKQMSIEQRMVTIHVSAVVVDVPVPVSAAPVAVPAAAAAPAESPPRQMAAPVVPFDDPAQAPKPKKKKKAKTGIETEDGASLARPVRVEGLATLTGEAWPPVFPREELEGHDVPEPKASATPRAPPPVDKVEVLSDEEPAPTLTQANVAKASAAAAMAAGVVEEPAEDDLELRSISPISTPGVFPWQTEKEKKAGKKKRAESPQDVKAKKQKADGKSKSKKLMASSGMQWDPYMPPSGLSGSPSPDAPRTKEKKKNSGEKKKRKDKEGKKCRAPREPAFDQGNIEELLAANGDSILAQEIGNFQHLPSFFWIAFMIFFLRLQDISKTEDVETTATST
eukprot:s607_g4.t1